MDGHLQKSPELTGDAKYVSGLSTILVATIQEAKDRISQIEYIFCSQLYPNIQSKSNIMQKIYSEARKAADDEWKEKENNLLLQIRKLQSENQNALSENHSLKLEMGAGPSVVKVENSPQLSPKPKSMEMKVRELEQELRLKSKEVDEGMVLANKLLKLVQSKSSAVVDKGKELREHEKNTNVLVADVKQLNKKVEDLQGQIKRKSDEVAMGLELQNELTEKIRNQASQIVNDEERLIHYEEERKLLIAKVEKLEKDINVLQEDFMRKTNEVEEGRKLQEQLYQQIDLRNPESLMYEQKMKESEEERNLLLRKVQSLEEEGAEHGKMAGGNESYENLLLRIDLQATALASEKNKRRDLTALYKRLKSQYDYLSKKSGITADNTSFSERWEEQKSSWSHSPIPDSFPDHENPNQETSTAACNTITLNDKISAREKLDNERSSNLPQTSSSHSPSFISPNPSKRPVEVKSAPLAGTKRNAHWRETRSHQRQDGPDPHDDFLDTPLENIKGNLKKAMKEVVHDLPPVPVPKDMNFDISDDETQDISAALNPQKHQMQPPNPVGTRGYKFVEPVRKKAERENLKGVECNQCKKFYDAVLPADGGTDTDGINKNLRCEHHDGVSRHRYRYAPPLTPEGFWNIGFDTES